MSMNIESKLNNENDFWEISLKGELDVSTADKLKEYLHNLADEKILKNNNKRTFFVEAENGAEILWETREFEWYLWDNKLVLIYLGDKYYQQYFIELEKIKDIIDTDFYEKYILQTPQEGE